MKKIKIMCLMLLGFGGIMTCSAQSLEPVVLSNSGSHGEAAGAQLSWTVGEPVIHTYETGTNILTQGFHQTMLTITQLAEPVPELELNVFPNPATEQLTLTWSRSVKSIQLRLIDMLGHVLLQQKVEDPGALSLDVSKYAAGEYLLQVYSKEFEAQESFKLRIVK